MNNSNPQIIFWDGISNLAIPEEHRLLAFWMDKMVKLKNSEKLSLFIQIFAGITTETFSPTRPILVAFSYIENFRHQILIIHISHQFSPQLFAQDIFTPLKEFLQNKHIIKYVYDKDTALNISSIFLDFFQIAVTGMKCIVQPNSKPWIEMLNEQPLREMMIKLKNENRNDLFTECIRNRTIEMTGVSYLTKETKVLSFSVISALFELYAAISTPEELNPHVIKPSASPSMFTPYNQQQAPPPSNVPPFIPIQQQQIPQSQFQPPNQMNSQQRQYQSPYQPPMYPQQPYNYQTGYPPQNLPNGYYQTPPPTFQQYSQYGNRPNYSQYQSPPR